jgi:hypothetical protein
MNNKAKVITVFVVLTLVGVVSFINFFIWPFQASSPNYKDVEKAFNAIKLPDGWEITSITENKGTAGRTCPMEGSGCFSKRASIKLPEGVDTTVYTRFLADAGCGPISVSDTSTPTSKMQTYYCNLKNGIRLGSDFKVDNRETSFITFTD